MADFTPNYNLEKPTGAEKYYISKFNANTDKIDTALKTQADEISANKTQEEEDIAELEQTLKTYTDDSVSAHNLNQQAHPYIQGLVDQALLDAKDYTDAKPNANEVVAAHNISDSAHSDIRDLINNMGSTTETAIDNAIDLHNVDPEAHQDIRTDAETYTDNAIEEHDNDPNAHGGKQVVYTNLTANGNDFISSMTSLDIQTAFQDGKSVTALLNGGGEIHLTVDNGVVSGTRTVINGDNLILETYTFDNSTVTKTVSKFKLDYAPALADEAIVDQSVIVDPETTVATIGSAVIGSARVSGETDSDSGKFIIELTEDAESSTETYIRYTHSYTLQEVYDEYISGKAIYALVTNGYEKYYYPLELNYYYDDGEDIPSITFMCIPETEYPFDEKLVTTFNSDYEMYTDTIAPSRPIYFARLSYSNNQYNLNNGTIIDLKNELYNGQYSGGIVILKYDNKYYIPDNVLGAQPSYVHMPMTFVGSDGEFHITANGNLIEYYPYSIYITETTDGTTTTYTANYTFSSFTSVTKTLRNNVDNKIYTLSDSNFIGSNPYVIFSNTSYTNGSLIYTEYKIDSNDTITKTVATVAAQTS